MKKNVALITILLFNIFSYAQKANEIPEPNIDSMLVHINKTGLTSSFLYDRTTPLANLTQYNTTTNTATTSYFEQALQELHNASNKTKFKTLQSARQYYKFIKEDNQVQIGIINAKFQNLNFNFNANEKGALQLDGMVFKRINNASVFLDHEVLIAAPLTPYAVGKTIHYRLNPELWFEDTNNPIASITADFDSGTKYTLYNKTVIANSIPVTYKNSGYKILTFVVLYKDGTIKTTYGKLHVKFPIASTKKMEDPLVVRDSIISTMPFPGYNETSPIYGELEYSIYYHTLNNESQQRILLKPIIIIDGFDPLDQRKIQDEDSKKPDTKHVSMEEFMLYFDYNNNPVDLIEALRNLGYDVILVNQPNYTRTVNGLEKSIDGGADYIERNALAHVSLYNELNATLFANGSSEKLVIVGPSMGGQISRYALAYMEKNNIDHNTRLWVSIDSPHLGANIPMGIQSMIDLLAGFGGSAAAQDFYNIQLKSTAAQQQVIDQHKTGQSSDYLNGGSPVFQQYYNNLNTNGLPGSNGYPQNLRKIAIVNGSIAGNHIGTPGQEDFRIHGFADGFLNNVDIKVAEMHTNYMPTTGNTQQVARLWRAGKPTRTASYTNTSIYGSLDVLPGGYFDSENQIHASVMGVTPDIYNFSNGISFGNLYTQALGFSLLGITGDHFESRTNKKIHTFIPTVSALGFTNPEFNWGEYIDTNLLCSDDIPFDSFYAPKINEQHTSFTEASVNWLLEELAGNPQPVNGSPSSSSEFLSGPNTLNECQTRQYTTPFVHKVNDYVWTLSGDNSGYCDWEIVSGQGSRIVTIRSGVGFGILTCRPRNSCGNGTMFYKNLQGNEVTESNCGPQLRISPNPNKGDPISIVLKLPPNDPCNQFRSDTETLDFSNYIGKNLWIYNFYGNLIYESLETSKETHIRSLNLTAGIYVIKRLDVYGKMHIGKLIIE